MAVENLREVKESPIKMGMDEQIAYFIETTPWGGSPSSVSVKIYDVSNKMTDVSATVLSGSVTVAGDMITLPLLIGLTIKHQYRLEVKFTSSGNLLEAFCLFIAER